MTKVFMKKGLVKFGSVAAILLSMAGNASACAMCAGQSDSKLALGMNWGIFSLLFVVVGVLGGVASVGFFFVKKAAAFEASQQTLVAPGLMPASAKG